MEAYSLSQLRRERIKRSKVQAQYLILNIKVLQDANLNEGQNSRFIPHEHSELQNFMILYRL